MHREEPPAFRTLWLLKIGVHRCRELKPTLSPNSNFPSPPLPHQNFGTLQFVCVVVVCSWSKHSHADHAFFHQAITQDKSLSPPPPPPLPPRPLPPLASQVFFFLCFSSLLPSPPLKIFKSPPSPPWVGRGEEGEREEVKRRVGKCCGGI